MKDEQHKNIDDVFRQVIDDPANEPEYRQDHWDALEEMLSGKKNPVKWFIGCRLWVLLQ